MQNELLTACKFEGNKTIWYSLHIVSKDETNVICIHINKETFNKLKKTGTKTSAIKL